MGDEHMDALFEGESLEEEFKFKAKTIFEAAVNDRVSQIQNELQESYSDWADLKVEKIRDGLVERMDSYLNYVIKDWMDETIDWYLNIFSGSDAKGYHKRQEEINLAKANR